MALTPGNLFLRIWPKIQVYRINSTHLLQVLKYLINGVKNMQS